MSNDGLLFPDPGEVLSPRLKWMRDNQVFTRRKTTFGPWEAFTFSTANQICLGDSEDEAIFRLAKANNWRLWNEKLWNE